MWVYRVGLHHHQGVFGVRRGVLVDSAGQSLFGCAGSCVAGVCLCRLMYVHGGVCSVQVEHGCRWCVYDQFRCGCG